MMLFKLEDYKVIFCFLVPKKKVPKSLFYLFVCLFWCNMKEMPRTLNST